MLPRSLRHISIPFAHLPTPPQYLPKHPTSSQKPPFQPPNPHFNNCRGSPLLSKTTLTNTVTKSKLAVPFQHGDSSQPITVRIITIPREA